MSVQLILYPQNYQGQFSSFGTPIFTEYVSDYSYNIGTLGTGFSGNFNSNQIAFYSNLSAPTNVWQQFNTTGGLLDATTAATISSGKATLNSSGSNFSFTGLYQLISNLTIGATYEIKVQRLTGTTGFVNIGFSSPLYISGTIYYPTPYMAVANTIGTQTFTFTATHTEHLFILDYTNNDGTSLEIGEVSIKESVGSAPTTDVFRDGQVICDLYEESYIPLSLSIDDFKNLDSKKQSFSKPFKLPATKRNNKIFTNLFDVTKNITDDAFMFNPYKKTKCILKEDSFTIFEGYLKLIDILEKEGETSYNVNLYADSVTLKDILKDKKFYDIEWTELTHNFNEQNIVNSFNGFVRLAGELSVDSFAYDAVLGANDTDVILYPMCRWNGNLYVDPADSLKLKMQKNTDAFRPWIKCKYLIDRIFDEAGFTFSSDFLNSSDFTNLYMDFNWGEGIEPVPAGLLTVIKMLQANVNHPDTTNTHRLKFDINVPAIYSGTTKLFTAVVDFTNIDGYISLVYSNSGALGTSEQSTLTAIHKDVNGNIVAQNSETFTIPGQDTNFLTQPLIRNFSFNYTINTNETLEVVISSTNQVSSSTLKYHSSLTTSNGTIHQSEFDVRISGEGEIPNLLNIARGEMKQWDFVSGLFKMFNLIALQDKDNPNNLIIEPYNDVFITFNSQYITSKTLTWTDKVDISEIKYNPVKLKKEVSFKYTPEPDDSSKNLYLSAVGQDFGSKILENNDFTLLEGEEKVQTTFASTFTKELPCHVNDRVIIPFIYKMNEDGTFTGYKNKPRILYNIGKTNLTNGRYQLEDGVNRSNYLKFSHLTNSPTQATTKDYNYETQRLPSYLGNVPVDNLYNTYWSPYYDELYNPDTRIVKLKIYLTPTDIANFEFYYKIRIKNRLYRVNKIEYKPYELSSVELILLS